MNSFGQLALIATISLLAAGGTYFFKGPPERLLHCDPATLKPDEVCLESIPAGMDVVWVDARSRKDWENNGVSGSLLWNLDPAEDMQVFEAEIAMKVAMNPHVIVYCGDENCGVSRQIGDRIRALDLGAEVFVLRGGWRALSEAGRVRGSSPES
jgi:rhodanese-related sulfurtransferase